jgi:hypothetical protein
MNVPIPGWAKTDVDSFRATGHFQNGQKEALDPITADMIRDVVTAIGMESLKSLDEGPNDELRGIPQEVRADWGGTKAHASFEGDTSNGTSTTEFAGVSVQVCDFTPEAMNAVTVFPDGEAAHGVHLDLVNPEKSYIETRDFNIAG